MVTRYTIDHILASNDARDITHSVSPVRSPEVEKTTLAEEASSIIPVLSQSKVIVRGDVEIREITRDQPTERSDGINGANRQDARNTFIEHGSGTAEHHEETSIINLSVRRKSQPEESGVPRRKMTNHSVLRPVPVRPNEVPQNGTLHDSCHEYTLLREHESALGQSRLNPTTNNHPVSDGFEQRPEKSLNSQGRDYPGLDMGNSVYSLMWRQYLEAQLRGMATTGPFVPLPYHVLDTALPHVANSVGIPYHVVNRSRRRGGQVRFTGDQTKRLEAWFHVHKYITPPQRKTIARELSLQERQVKTWFQNRRAKWRKAEGQNGVEASPSDVGPSPSPSHDTSGDDLDEDTFEQEPEPQEELIVDEDQPEVANTPSNCNIRRCQSPADQKRPPKNFRVLH
ncbi:homeobox protein H2.0-like [Macrobrachium rosenbergii]|uniref:homeobox protein H2.0-like n=1 Tax=Macrobrachium rosenbergii TaxID=79674 RepID=UPI0034D724FA